MRPATLGETITTTLANGTVETVNTVSDEHSVIITNPGGEQYIISQEKFLLRYVPASDPDTYIAKGMARMVQNPTGQPIQIVAPWGEVQRGDSDCLLATVFDPENPDEVSLDRYIIGAVEFLETYTLYIPAEYRRTR